MIRSNGVLKATSPQVLWQGTTATAWPTSFYESWRYSGYGELYRRQLWVYVLVNKLANALARLPLKVYERTDSDGRVEQTDSPYATLLAQPSRFLDPFSFWVWTSSTADVYGESFLYKRRDLGGRPIELVPIHPTRMFSKTENGAVVWSYDVYDEDGRLVRQTIDRHDFVHFRYYDPCGSTRGLSKLEPLRSTLENEYGARTANSALWRNGGRPSMVLAHPGSLSDVAVQRLAAQWADVHGGVENWGKALILEEAMTATQLALNNEELQYVQARELNREEMCAAFDVPPPVVHILDHATYSNITEQMRSMYRDTMAPRIEFFESTLEFELRDGRMGDTSRSPDFGDDVYAEFLMDEVLRGSFEARQQAYALATYMTLGEKRALENLPHIDGTDALYVNAADVPLVSGDEEVFERDRYDTLGLLIRSGFDAASSLAALGLPPIVHTGAAPVTLQPADDGVLEALPPTTPTAVRALLGRLGRVKTLDELDLDVVHDPALGALLARWRADALDVTDARRRLAALLTRPKELTP